MQQDEIEFEVWFCRPLNPLRGFRARQNQTSNSRGANFWRIPVEIAAENAVRAGKKEVEPANTVIKLLNR